MSYNLRPYQLSAIETGLHVLNDPNVKHLGFEMATGMGVSITLLELLDRYAYQVDRPLKVGLIGLPALTTQFCSSYRKRSLSFEHIHVGQMKKPEDVVDFYVILSCYPLRTMFNDNHHWWYGNTRSITTGVSPHRLAAAEVQLDAEIVARYDATRRKVVINTRHYL